MNATRAGLAAAANASPFAGHLVALLLLLCFIVAGCTCVLCFARAGPNRLHSEHDPPRHEYRLLATRSRGRAAARTRGWW